MSIISDDSDPRLAARLHIEREGRGWSIADLAARSSVSRAMISKIERGEASPTAALLGRLSAAFGLTMSQLFARIECSGGLVTRASEQPAWRDPATGFRRRSLSPPADAPMELVLGEMPPRAAVAYPAESYLYLLDQQIVVLSGQLTVVHGGETYVLDPGDCMRYGPPSDSVIRNDGAETARYIVAVLRRSIGGG
jgi:transcriptional regulator with XRE-family HTH domain